MAFVAQQGYYHALKFSLVKRQIWVR